MSDQTTTNPLKGFRDFLPEQTLQRTWLKDKIQETFQLWGFDLIETPTLEPLSIFAGQIGEDEKLFYQFTDNGGREVALRYDQTVPTARFVGRFRSELPFPYRRAQIQPVFRAEKPQLGRYREFLQCDADIFGIAGPTADAEVIALSLDIYRQIGFPQVVLKLNDRKILKDFPYAAITTIDKLKKIGEDGVIQEMVEKGISLEDAKGYLQTMTTLQPNEDIQFILKYVKSYGFDDSWIEFDPTIARSFSYSDGPIWEVVIPNFRDSSVLGGERYDKLLSSITGTNIPATGFAVGFDRTLEAAVEMGLAPLMKTTTQVLVALFDENALGETLRTATNLRQAGLNVEVYPAFDKLGKQFKLADQKGIPFVVIIGENEVKENKVTVKNMQTGDQSTVAIDEAIAVIRS